MSRSRSLPDLGLPFVMLRESGAPSTPCYADGGKRVTLNLFRWLLGRPHARAMTAD